MTESNPAASSETPSSAASPAASGWSSSLGSSLGRFTLRHLFLWTAFVAVGCVALRNASASWAAALLGAALAFLAASLLLAAFRDGRSRAFWIGFATVGWLYVALLAYSSGVDTSNGRWTNPFRPDALITTQLSQAFYSWMCEKISPPPVNPPGMMSGFGGMAGGPGMPMAGGMGSGDMGSASASMYGSYDATGDGYGAATEGGAMSGMGGPMGPPPAPTPFIPVQHDFTNVAHALWAVLLAACGGTLASWLYATRPKADENRAETGSVR